MLDGMFRAIQEALAPKEAFSPQQEFVSQVLSLLQKHKQAFAYDENLQGNFCFRRYTAEAKNGEKKIRLTIIYSRDTIEVILSDGDLRRGTPPSESFCYRVDVLSGSQTQTYRESTGYGFGSQEIRDNKKRGSRATIFSDRWSETTINVQDALTYIRNITEFLPQS